MWLSLGATDACIRDSADSRHANGSESVHFDEH